MTDFCENCNAYMRVDEERGLCRAEPPTPVMVSVQAPKVQGVPPTPLFQALFPTVAARCWCRQHKTMADMSKLDASQFSRIPVEGSA